MYGAAWIGVDLDGTLAEYHGWVGPDHIGAPIPAMLERVDKWLNEGKQVRIVTARMDPARNDCEATRRLIERWLLNHLGRMLPITHAKDSFMFSLWDDRAVQVEANTGVTLEDKLAVATRLLQNSIESLDKAHAASARLEMELEAAYAIIALGKSRIAELEAQVETARAQHAVRGLASKCPCSVPSFRDSMNQNHEKDI